MSQASGLLKCVTLHSNKSRNSIEFLGKLHMIEPSNSQSFSRYSNSNYLIKHRV